MKLNCYENYPRSFVFISNLLQIAIYVIGAIIISQIDLVWILPYFLYIIFLEIQLLKRSCVNCYYYGKICAFGQGKLCSLFFKKGNPKRFAKRNITWKDIVPSFLVSVIPIVVGIIILVIHFNWLILILVIMLLLLTFTGNGLVRGKLACKYCKQRELGCPAEKLFNKKKK
jgi:hypothetical protein